MLAGCLWRFEPWCPGWGSLGAATWAAPLSPQWWFLLEMNLTSCLLQGIAYEWGISGSWCASTLSHALAPGWTWGVPEERCFCCLNCERMGHLLVLTRMSQACCQVTNTVMSRRQSGPDPLPHSHKGELSQCLKLDG